MAVNPNELFYRGYNPAALIAGYDDTWAVESWREVPKTKVAPAPVQVQAKKEEKTNRDGAALYSGYFGENGPRGKPRPVTRIASLQERKTGYGGNWFIGRRPAVTRAPSMQDHLREKESWEKKGIVELRMPLCCEGCVEKVQRKFKTLKGVASVECSQEKQKVIVRGSATPEEILKRAKATLPRSSFWEEEI